MEKVRHVPQRLAALGGFDRFKKNRGTTDADDEASKERFEYLVSQLCE